MSLFENPYIAFSATLMGGGDVDDAFSAFRDARNFKEEQRRYALQEERAKQIIEEANREAEYKEQIDQVISRGGDIETMFKELQPLVLGMTGNLNTAIAPSKEVQTLMDSPETVTQYEVNPFTGERKAIGQGYSDYGRQMKYLKAQEAMQRRMAAYRQSLQPAPSPGGTSGEDLLGLVKAFTPEKASAAARSGLLEGVQNPQLKNYFNTLAQRDAVDTGINELVSKVNRGDQLTPQETARLDLLMNFKQKMSPMQSLEAAFLGDIPGFDVPTTGSMVSEYQQQYATPNQSMVGQIPLRSAINPPLMSAPGAPVSPAAPYAPADPFSPEEVQKRLENAEKKKKKEEKKKKKEEETSSFFGLW